MLAAHGLSRASFDVMATLRRSGKPYRLSPGDLLAATMVTSGTMTNRIDRLTTRGLVERRTDPNDGRSIRVRMTDEGRVRVDETEVADTRGYLFGIGEDLIEGLCGYAGVRVRVESGLRPAESIQR